MYFDNQVSFKLIKLDTIILDNPVKIVIDTGANYSIIFSNTINRLELNNLINYDYVNEFSGIGKSESKGRIDYMIQLNNIYYNILLNVCNEQIDDIDIIIGIDFLYYYNVIINFKINKIIIDDNEILFNVC